MAPSLPILGALAVLSIAAQLAGPGWIQTLQFEREAIAAGQWWRLVTGHLVHLGWSHLAMNLAGLAVLGLGFGLNHSGRRFTALGFRSSARSLAGLVVLMLGISVWLLLLNTELAWYRGLSGVLHGLAIFIAVDLSQRDRATGLLLLGGTVAKVAWEQWGGATILVEQQIGGAVVVDAHLYGVVAALLYAGFHWARGKFWSLRSEPTAGQ